MRKTKLMLISLICILCGFGCGKKNQQTVDWVYLTPDKPEIKIEKAIDLSGSYEISEYDRNGNRIKFEMYDKYGHVKYSCISTYDDNQNLITEARKNNNGVTSYKKNVYDKDGNLIKEYEGDDENSLHIEAEYEYKKGLLDNRIYYNDDGSIWDIKEYEYEDGLLTKETVNSDTGYVYRTYVYEYDAAGNKTKMTDSMYGHDVIYFYDSEERLIREEYYYEEKLSGVFENQYGDYGITDEYSYDPDGNIERHIKTYYDEKGQMSKKVSVNEKGKETVNTTFEYDAYGNLTHYWNSRGYETTTKYNEYGYPVFKHEVCTDFTRNAGTYDITTQFEYVYFE